MDDITAELKIIGVMKNGEKINITARIGKPYPVVGHEDIDEWACPVSLTPLYDHLHDTHGNGSFQSLALALKLVIHLLRGFKDTGGKLMYDDGAEFSIESY
ncbi:MAG: hypothetical protein WC799_19080 [Desulfobacteraceae bacterium]|jgi:hypothetical protein